MNRPLRFVGAKEIMIRIVLSRTLCGYSADYRLFAKGVQKNPSKTKLPDHVTKPRSKFHCEYRVRKIGSILLTLQHTKSHGMYTTI